MHIWVRLIIIILYIYIYIYETRNEKKQENVTPNSKENQTTERIPEMMEVLDRPFKELIISMFKDVKENINIISREI
jgi:hypothetical protein